MKKIEIILTSIAFIAMVLFLFRIAGGMFFLVFSLGILSIFYFYLGFVIYNGLGFKKEDYKGISAKRAVGTILAGIATSILSIGLLFRLMHWPGSMPFLYLGTTGLSIAGVVALVKFLTTKSDYYKTILIRVTLWLLVGFTWMFCRNELNRFRYRNYPAYVNAYENYKANPDNKALRDSLEAEENKILQKRSQPSQE